MIQILFGRGSFDIDDFILNMVGISIGYVIGKWKPLRIWHETSPVSGGSGNIVS
ncbi:MAG: hypothetical protein ACI4QB_08290 [Eubacteriales bacterium]